MPKKHKTDIVVRITSDCPLMDYRIIDEMLIEFKKNNFDYYSNIHPPSFPDGFDIEIFTFDALKKAFKNSKKNFQKEHVTPYIWDNPKLFKIENFKRKKIENNLYEKYRLTLDFIEDYVLIKKIYDKLYFKDKNFSFSKIHKFLKENNSLVQINKKYIKFNWYALYLNKLKSISKKDTKLIK